MQALDFPLRISRGTILRNKQVPLNKKKINKNYGKHYFIKVKI